MADTASVRKWAREQGYPVGDRGRLSPDLVRAYEAAHGGEHVQPAVPAARGRRSSSTRGGTGRASAVPPQTAPAGEGARTVHARTPWDWPRRG